MAVGPLRRSSSVLVVCTCNTPEALRQAAQGPASLPSLKEERKSDRGRRRGNDAPLMCTRCLSIRGHESPKNTELCDHLRNAPHCSGFLRAFVTDGRQRSDTGKHRALAFPSAISASFIRYRYSANISFVQATAMIFTFARI